MFAELKETAYHKALAHIQAMPTAEREHLRRELPKRQATSPWQVPFNDQLIHNARSCIKLPLPRAQEYRKLTKDDIAELYKQNEDEDQPGKKTGRPKMLRKLAYRSCPSLPNISQLGRTGEDTPSW